MTDVHESVTRSGIVVPDPDQGTAYIALQCSMPSTMLMAWEPFEDGTPGGHNLFGFGRRWAAWKASDEPFLQTVDPRFGHPMLIPRAAIDQVISFAIQYHRKEDTRAGLNSLAVPVGPGARRMPNGDIEIRVPR